MTLAVFWANGSQFNKRFNSRCIDKNEMRKEILNNGWRQGSLIKFNTIKAYSNEEKLCLLPAHDEFDEPESVYLVAINMSCDVIFGDTKSLPEVKFLVCHQKNGGTKRNDKIQDPRKMVLEHDGNVLSFEMKDRAFIHKSVLANIKPDGYLSEDQVKSLVRWKVAQFNRLGLPEDLVELIGSSLRNRNFLKWVKSIASKAEGVFLEVRAIVENKNVKKYELGVLVVADSGRAKLEDINLMEEKLQDLLLEGLRNIQEINLLNDSEYPEQGLDSVISSSDFTYDMLKRFRRYYLDEYSLDPGASNSPIGA